MQARSCVLCAHAGPYLHYVEPLNDTWRNQDIVKGPGYFKKSIKIEGISLQVCLTC